MSQRRHRAWSRSAGAALALALLAILAAVVLVVAPGDGPREGYARTLEAASQRPALQSQEGGDDFLDRFANVAAFAKPAVVRIESQGSIDAEPPAQVPEMFQPFFGPEPAPMPRVSGGSGFIVSPDGHILTNAHVVQGNELTVWLDDRRAFDAELVGMDRTTDVAVLDIDATDLPTLPMGDSDELRVGDWVLAIGSPGVGAGQLEQTVTSGIVSALGRPLQLLSQDLFADPTTREFAGYAIENFIQTDAVINPGNSGGPLVDMDGRVVGITTAIASPTGYFLGYGFAVPSNLVAGVMEDLVEFGEVRRGQLGVNVTTITPEDAEFFQLGEVRGVLVQSAAEGGPAAEAGIRRGDVILSVDEQPVDRVGELQQEIAERSPGDEVRLSIVREGRRESVTVTLGEAELPPAGTPPPPESREALDRLGLSIGALTDARRAELGYDAAVTGAVVLDVTPMGPAYRKGIEPGVLIREVAGEPVRSPEEVTERLAQVEAGEVTALLLMTPDGSERLVTLRVPS